MLYKFADFVFEINGVPSTVEKICSSYLCFEDLPIDFRIELSEADVTYEIEKASSMGMPQINYSNYYSLALYRKICSKILNVDGFLLHGAVIEYEGRGHLFTAKSGTGKTTHIRLWQSFFGEDKVTIVNGDKPIIRFIDGKFYAYGTPWCGKEGYNCNKRVELSDICFIERDHANSIYKLSDTEAFPRLYSQIMIDDSSNLARQLELCDLLIQKVPMYLLKCNRELEAVKVAYDTIGR